MRLTVASPMTTARDVLIIVRLVVGISWIAVSLAAPVWIRGAPFIVVFWLLATWITFPQAGLRRLLEPAGLYRAARYHTLLLGPHFAWGDLQGGALLAAARAIARRPSAAGTRWLHDQVEGRRDHQAGGLMAAAILARLNGQSARAKQLFLAVDHLPVLPWDGANRLAARRWRVAYAAEKGDWAEAIRAAERSGPAGLVLRSARARALGLPAPNPLTATLGWMFAGFSLRLWPFLREAWAAGLTEEAGHPRPSPSLARPGDPDDPLSRALTLQQRLLAGPPCPPSGWLTEVGAAWDQVAGDPAVFARLTRRALALNLQDDPSTFRDRLLDDAVRELVGFLRAHPDPLPTATGPTLIRTYAALQEDQMRDLEVLIRDMRRRHKSGAVLSCCDEWVAYLTLKQLWERTFSLSTVADGTPHFIRMWDAPCNLAVELHNKAGEKLLGHTMFTWLHGEAVRFEHEPAITLLAKNIGGSKPKT